MPSSGSRPSHDLARLAAALCLGLPMAACMTQPKPQPNSVRVEDDVQRQADRQFTKEPFDDQVRQGVIRQKAIFESQFKPDTSELTSIGQRNVHILAQAMRESGGRIAVPRGSATSALYNARLATVRKALADEGIARDRVEVGDGVAGGPGISTAEALSIRASMAKKPMQESGGQTLNPFGDGKVVGGN
jgi:hypothetical protein